MAKAQESQRSMCGGDAQGVSVTTEHQGRAGGGLRNQLRACLLHELAQAQFPAQDSRILLIIPLKLQQSTVVHFMCQPDWLRDAQIALKTKNKKRARYF